LYVVPALSAGAPRLSVKIDPSVIDRSAPLWKPSAWVGNTIFLTTERQLLRFDEGTRQFRNLTALWKVTPNFINVRPDGARVLYLVNAQSHNDLWIANVDGSDAVQLTNDPFAHRDPIWAGNDAIVYASDKGGQDDLWRMNVSDRSQHQITFSADRETPESASADGMLLTYQNNTDEADLWEVDPRTGTERQLTTDGRSYFWPSATSSRLIASQIVKAQHHGARIPLLDTDVVVGVRDGTGFHLLAQREVDSFAPRLSLDGKWLAFLQWPTQQDVSEPMLFVTELETGVHTKVADRFAIPGHTVGPPFDRVGSAVVWSRDRQDLYFVARNASTVPEIRRLRAGSSEGSEVIVRDFNAKTVVLDLALSNDGKRLAYNSWLGNRVEIHVHDLASHEDRVVWMEPASRFMLEIKGWRGDDNALIALRSPKPDASPAELVQIGLDGSVAAPLLVAERAHPHGARFSAASGELYLTIVDGLIDNVSAFSVKTGRLRRLTHNTLTGVTFSGLEPVSDGTLVFSRQESKNNIWAIRFRR
jgi:hypothetical protein